MEVLLLLDHSFWLATIQDGMNEIVPLDGDGLEQMAASHLLHLMCYVDLEMLGKNLRSPFTGDGCLYALRCWATYKHLLHLSLISRCHINIDMKIKKSS